ncbi:DNA polymerase III subunit epsilon [Acidithiobacillus sp.]|uniref:DNA polymerase III subunit epsilon n=1 Tax=Acidithiobacillus sp. TaxID=1872118 RepID=UPI0025C5112B|nr:DNA polymerase III subunit epsilon [Acidithiobacillus sp.]MCK9189211.1 DNA polymerase III subunit epsilon [Acidithiobacillus sp.]MCK9359469.1 DNA polymerase III subunit epsilon [Acidithiobacillus sp.]
MAMRQVVLDTETTGIDWKQGHRVIEIGAVELIDRRVTGVHYQQYLNPQRSSDPEALRVHGLTDEFLQDKPGFVEVADAFLDFLGDAELIIHNAPFDLGFLNYELQQVARAPLRQAVMDTLVDARRRHPGQKNDLNSLCRRYNVDNSRRDLHGALLDCEILAEVYLAMTGGQVDMMGLLGAVGGSHAVVETQRSGDGRNAVMPTPLARPRDPLRVIRASSEECAAHQQYLRNMGVAALWSED